MPKYYCDYCDTYLTHDSPSVRKTHCGGRKHKDNVKFYYQKLVEDQAQAWIDATTAAYQAGQLTPAFYHPSMSQHPGGAVMPAPGFQVPHPWGPMPPGGYYPGPMPPPMMMPGMQYPMRAMHPMPPPMGPRMAMAPIQQPTMVLPKPPS